MRLQQMSAVGCKLALSIDGCKASGKVLGGKWQALATQEDNLLLGSKLTNSTSLKELEDWLTEMMEDPDVNPQVVLLDNVPPQHLDANGRRALQIIP